MNRALIVGRAARVIAIAIALAAAIDPAVTSPRTVRRTVTVTSDDRIDDALADRVARNLEQHFTVIRAPFAAADAAVSVGESVPAFLDELAVPFYAVVPDSSVPTVRLRAISAPARTPVYSRVPIAVTADVYAARGTTLELSLRAGDLLIDHVVRPIQTDRAHLTIPLTFLPTSTGAAPLRVVATLGGKDSTHADFVVDARDTQWSVLFFDPRPSWLSTFVRRSLERDPRFSVASRVVTSRNVGVNAGQPPSRLDDLAGIDRFDVIVIGAPNALAAADVAGLNRFLRRRGGSAVLLFDEPSGTGPYSQLTGPLAWTHRALPDTATLRDRADDSLHLRASDLIWPTVLPIGAYTLARVTFKGDTDGVPVVWQSPVGGGRLIVSGALDSWRFRDAAFAPFDRYWQTLIGRAAAEALPPATVVLSPAVVRPNESSRATATLRDALLWTPTGDAAQHGPSIALSTSLLSPTSAHPSSSVRAWPTAVPGQLHGAVRAPSSPGVYSLTLSANGATTTTPLVVRTDAQQTHSEERELLGQWSAAYGGRLISAAHLDELAAALTASAPAVARMVTWHPMRSAWWIIPFACALGVEWTLRRRRVAG